MYVLEPFYHDYESTKIHHNILHLTSTSIVSTPLVPSSLLAALVLVIVDALVLELFLVLELVLCCRYFSILVFASIFALLALLLNLLEFLTAFKSFKDFLSKVSSTREIFLLVNNSFPLFLHF